MKKKLLHTLLAGAVIVGGSGFAGFSAQANEQPSPSAPPMLMSAPVQENSTQSYTTKFTDIADHWAYEHIVELEEKGVWSDAEGAFLPDQPVSKDALLQHLNDIFEFETDGAPNLDFIAGTHVTRMETARAIEASFVAKKLSLIMTLVFPVYDDTADLTQEETSALSFVFNTNIMKGRSSQNFHPGEALTRAELAAVLSRTLAAIEIAEQTDELDAEGAEPDTDAEGAGEGDESDTDSEEDDSEDDS